MTKEMYDFSECVAALVLGFTRKEKTLADENNGKLQDRLDVGKTIGQIDAYNQAAKEILELLDQFKIESEYINSVRTIFENLEIDIIFQADEEKGAD